MTDVWRCPDCGCLALSWSHAHRRGCAYGLTPPEELAYAMSRSTSAEPHTQVPDPPEYGIPQKENE